MPWYRTGTIALTNGSATVNGTGTDFVTNARVGEALVAPDNRIYEIAAVVSTTSLTLARTYLGSTASGQAYSIAPTRSQAKDLLDQVTTLVSQFGSVRDNAGAGLFAAGTVSAPSVRATTDTNTGLNLPGNDVAQIVTGGVVRQTWSATGTTLAVPVTFANDAVSQAAVAGATRTNTIENGTNGGRQHWDVKSKTGGGADVVARVSSYGDGASVGIGSASAHPVDIYVGGAVAGRWDANGNLLVGVSSGNFHVFAKGLSGNFVAEVRNTAASNPLGIAITYSAAQPNNSSQWFIYCGDVAGQRMGVASNGNLVNQNNSYGAISDAKLKQDVNPAGSQWADVKALAAATVKYRLKADGDAGPVLMGFVAQDVEAISPGLVDSTPDFEEVQAPKLDDDGNPVLGDDGEPVMETLRQPTGTVTKSVKYSVAYMKAFKALGEALERIEALETANAALAARLDVLEAAQGG